MATAPCRSRTAASRSRRCLGSAEKRPVAPSRPPDGGVWDRSPLAIARPRPPPTGGVSVTSCAVGSPAVRCKSPLQLVSSAWVAGRQSWLFRAPGLPPGAAAVGKPPFRQRHGDRRAAGPSDARPRRRPTGRSTSAERHRPAMRGWRGQTIEYWHDPDEGGVRRSASGIFVAFRVLRIFSKLKFASSLANSGEVSG